MVDDKICKTLKLARSTYLRWLSEDGRRAKLQEVRSQPTYPVLKALYDKALSGAVGAAREILSRIEQWDP